MGQIGGYCDYVSGKFALACGQPGDGCCQVFGAARNDSHARALTQKAGGASQPDAAAAAGDEYPLIAEFEIHDGVFWQAGSADVVRQMANPVFGGPVATPVRRQGVIIARLWCPPQFHDDE
jgi:hypothetical protein